MVIRSLILPICVAGGLTTLGLMAAFPASAEVYRVPNFGFRLDVPAGTRRCSTNQTGQDHGPLIALDPKRAAKYCSDGDKIRYVSVSGWWNATDDTKTLDLWFKSELALYHGTRVAAPRGLRFEASNVAAAGRVDEAAGWSDIFVVAQRLPQATRSDPYDGGINYEATLHTDQAHLRADLTTFRRILASIGWTPYPH